MEVLDAAPRWRAIGSTPSSNLWTGLRVVGQQILLGNTWGILGVYSGHQQDGSETSILRDLRGLSIEELFDGSMGIHNYGRLDGPTCIHCGHARPEDLDDLEEAYEITSGLRVLTLPLSDAATEKLTSVRVDGVEILSALRAEREQAGLQEALADARAEAERYRLALSAIGDGDLEDPAGTARAALRVVKGSAR